MNFKTTLLIASVLSLGQVGVNAQTTILGGATGNADFEASSPASGQVPYDSTNNWFNASGAETLNFTHDTQMNGSSQSASRGGMPFNNRAQVNDTGYTITAAGKVFTLSYDFGAGGGLAGWNGDEFLDAFLFTIAAGDTVDGDLVEGNFTETLVTNTYNVDRANDGQWTTHTAPTYYTTSAADVGKTVYLGIKFSHGTGNILYPRIDVIQLSVVTPTPPPSSTILGGSTGNADFEASTPATGALPFSSTTNWFNASGAESTNFSNDSQTAGSSQPNSRGGMPFDNRIQVNSTGFTITAADEVISLSYEFGATGLDTNWTGDEVHNSFLFTIANGDVVDGDLVEADFTEVLTTDSYSMDRPNNDSWTTRSVPYFYITTAADIGKTLYFGMKFDQGTGPTVFPRIDVISLTIGTIPPPLPATGWDEFVTQYGLTGIGTDDFDGDGQVDLHEFAFGGNPTDASSQGAQPAIEIVNAGNEAAYRNLATNHSDPGISYVTEWSEDLTATIWQRTWDSSSTAATSDPDFNEKTQEISTSGKPRLFARTMVTQPDRPNILLILADDLGYADVGFNGSTDIITPEMDVLAQDGTIFSSAYVVHPFCGPSRMGLFTGRYPHEYGGPFNLPPYSSGDYRDQGTPTSETLISTVLKNGGYSTGLMGKWHLGHEPQSHPNVRGFDHFYGFLGGGILYFGPYQANNAAGTVWDYRIYPQENGVDDTSLTANDYMTDVLSQKGIDFINAEASNDDPFFLMMSYNAPHTVLAAKQEDLDVFPTLTGDRQTYAAMVYALDRGIGDIVDTLKSTGQYDNTLIIFLSDNGGRTDQGANNSPLRGAKGDTWEGGFRVPMFMHWPNRVPAQTTYTHPVSALDFYPTFARLAGAAIPAGKEIDGKNIWDEVLAGESARPGELIYALRHRPGATSQYHSVGGRMDQWKAYRDQNSWSLYNIETDIGETTDVSAQNPTILTQMIDDIEAWSNSHVQPLWWDNTSQEQVWNDNNMPLYDQTFSHP
ncbi:MAG: sulfatase-like hydrolase/transferase [Roseibacillus sp.]